MLLFFLCSPSQSFAFFDGYFYVRCYRLGRGGGGRKILSRWQGGGRGQEGRKEGMTERYYYPIMLLPRLDGMGKAAAPASSRAVIKHVILPRFRSRKIHRMKKIWKCELCYRCREPHPKSKKKNAQKKRLKGLRILIPAQK